MHGELSAYRIAFLELKELLDESTLHLSIAEAAVPIKAIVYGEVHLLAASLCLGANH